MPSLTEKVAIVTGGTGGLGRAMVQRFVEAGAGVIIADIDEAKGVELQNQMGSATLFHKTDVSRTEDVQSMINCALEHFGGLDVIVNNAAISCTMHPRLLDEDFADFDRVMRVNLLGVMLGTQLAAKQMAVSTGGSIINISATSGITAGFALPIYRLAKIGVIHFSQAAAIDLGEYGIRVNCIAPGNIATEMNSFTSETMDANKQKKWDDIRNRIRMSPQPLKREGTARDVAESALFLASEQSAQITGMVLPVDGGITAGDPGNHLMAVNHLGDSMEIAHKLLPEYLNAL